MIAGSISSSVMPNERDQAELEQPEQVESETPGTEVFDGGVELIKPWASPPSRTEPSIVVASVRWLADQLVAQRRTNVVQGAHDRPTVDIQDLAEVVLRQLAVAGDPVRCRDPHRISDDAGDLLGADVDSWPPPSRGVEQGGEAHSTSWVV